MLYMKLSISLFSIIFKPLRSDLESSNIHLATVFALTAFIESGSKIENKSC